MAYRKIGVEERALWLLQVDAAGWPDNPLALARVAKQKNAPSVNTLKRWVESRHEPVKLNPIPQDLVDVKRFDFVQAIEDEMKAIIQEWPHARDSADYRALMTAFGILTEKRQLLSGKATEHNDTHIRITYENPDD